MFFTVGGQEASKRSTAPQLRGGRGGAAPIYNECHDVESLLCTQLS